MSMWNRWANRDDENLRFCWLRAVEWGNWPAFVSQPVVPIALLFWPWKSVVFTTAILNILWVLFIRYRIVIVPLAYWGALFVRLKWIACPLAAFFLYRRGQTGVAVLALLWPVAVMIFGPMLAPKIGIIQEMFMQRLGYTRKEETQIQR